MSDSAPVLASELGFASVSGSKSTSDHASASPSKSEEGNRMGSVLGLEGASETEEDEDDACA